MPSASFGELAALLTALIWAGSLTAYKRFGAEVPAPFLTLFQGIVAIPCLLAVCFVGKVAFPTTPTAWYSLIASGLVGVILADTAFFYALRHLTVGMTTVVQCLVPPLSAVIAWIFLGEKVLPTQWTGMALTLAAIGVVIYQKRKSGDSEAVAPGGTPQIETERTRVLRSGLAAALFASLAEAVHLVCARHGFTHSNIATGTLIRIIPPTVLLGIFWIATHRSLHFRFTKQRRNIFALGITAFFGNFIGLIIMSASLKYANVGVASTIFATYPLWILPMANRYLGETVHMTHLWCTLVAVVGIALMLLPGGVG